MNNNRGPTSSLENQMKSFLPEVIQGLHTHIPKQRTGMSWQTRASVPTGSEVAMVNAIRPRQL